MSDNTLNELPEKETPGLEAVVLVLSPDERLLRWLDTCWADFTLRLLRASDADEAESLSHAGDPDLILIHAETDLEEVLPVCENLRRICAQSDIFIVRSSHTIQDHLKCLRLGCDGILPFPPEPAQMTQIVTGSAIRRKSQQPSVLWIDDDMNLMKVFAAMLRKAGLNVSISVQPMDTFEVVASANPDLLMLDYEMPGVNGAELCRMIRLRPEYRTLPILILTGSSDPEVRRKCLEAGADDFIRKPIEIPDLVARIQAKIIRGDMLRTLATQDPLTLLNTHQAFLDILTRECARAQRFGTSLGLGVIDVDRFTEINLQHSFSVGDEVLRKIAGALRERFRRSDTIGRIGGDRFAVLLSDIDRDTALEVLREFIGGIEAVPFQPTPATSITLSLRAGLACFPAEGANVRNLLSASLHALQEAKRATPPRVVGYQKKR